MKADRSGSVTIILPHHRDIVVPLEPKEAAKLVEKLNELIPAEKQRELERIMKKHKLQRIEKEKRRLAEEELITPATGPQMPIPEPSGVRRIGEEAEEEIEEKEE